MNESGHRLGGLLTTEFWRQTLDPPAEMKVSAIGSQECRWYTGINSLLLPLLDGNEKQWELEESNAVGFIYVKSTHVDQVLIFIRCYSLDYPCLNLSCTQFRLIYRTNSHSSS